MLVSRLKSLASTDATRDEIKAPGADVKIETPQDRKAAEDLLKDFEALLLRCQAQLRSIVTPMGVEMFYRYQESLIQDSATKLAALLRRQN